MTRHFPLWPQICWLALLILLLMGLRAIGGPDKEGTAAKRPVPSAAEQKDATRRVEQVYRQDVAAAKTAKDKIALAERLVTTAETSGGGADAERFVLFIMARDLAARSGSASLAIRAIDELAEWCDIDSLKMRADALAVASKVADEKLEGGAATEDFEAVIDAAIRADRYDVAKGTAASASAFAARSRKQGMARWATSLSREVDEFTTASRNAATADATLRKTPDDPAAAYTVGRFLCLFKEDWARGLPLLAASKDSILQPLARDELTGPATATAKVLLGDRWLAVGQSQTGIACRSAEDRAAKWYRSALPELNGLDKAAAEKKLESLNERGWLVLLRSADPSIWNKHTTGGEDHFAVELSHCPDDVRYLKLSAPDKGYVIVPITKEQLPKLNSGATFNWNGTAHHEWGGTHLGIDDVRMEHKGTGFIDVTKGYRGWGFGHKVGIDKEQCWSWAGEEIPSTVFEISVTASPLTAEESKFVLR
ncbi:MAG: hypothetical protein JWN24_2073 [Phycisphaerales bacterium]|nr:hypothetical protein [Phycisphaerales bacterium]